MIIPQLPGNQIDHQVKLPGHQIDDHETFTLLLDWRSCQGYHAASLIIISYSPHRQNEDHFTASCPPGWWSCYSILNQIVLMEELHYDQYDDHVTVTLQPDLRSWQGYHATKLMTMPGLPCHQINDHAKGRHATKILILPGLQCHQINDHARVTMPPN